MAFPASDRVSSIAGTDYLICTDQVLRDYRNSMIHAITGAPTTFINDELYAMSGPELLEAVKMMLET